MAAVSFGRGNPGRGAVPAAVDQGDPNERGGNAEHQQAEYRFGYRVQPPLYLFELGAEPTSDRDLEPGAGGHLPRPGQVDDKPSHDRERDGNGDIDRVGDDGTA